MSLHDQVLGIMKPYLGIAAPDMLKRTVRMVGIEPGELSSEHLQSLAYWILIGAKQVMSEERAQTLAAAIRDAR